jgi:hypothetical protein
VAITSSARHDAFTVHSYGGDIGEPNNSWGFGKLDVQGALALVSPSTGRALVLVNNGDSSVRSSRRGTLLPLQSVRVAASDAESLTVTRLVVRAEGADRAFRLGALIDANRNGAPDESESLIALTDSLPLDGARDIALSIPAGRAIVPRGGTVDILLVGQLSGTAPSASSYAAAVITDSTQTVGLRSGVAMVALGDGQRRVQIRTTVLAGSERLALSQNPVRRSPLVMSFGEVVTGAALFDFGGRRVRAFAPASDERTIRWDLTNDHGEPVANGAYLMVIDLESGSIRKKIFVAR